MPKLISPISRILSTAILICGLWALLPSEKSYAATTYYVDCNSGNDNNNGTSTASAWKGLDPVIDKNFQPGDVIRFKKGCSWDTGYEYGGLTSNLGLVIDTSGTSSSPITFTSYGSGAKPRFYNTYNENIYVRGIGIYADWVVLNDLKINAVHEFGVYINNNADYNTVRNLEITDVGTGVQINGTYNLIISNYIHDLNQIVSTPGGDDDYGAVGVTISGSNNEISYNKIVNAIDSSYDYGVNGGGIEFYGALSGTSVHHNWFEGCDGVFEMGYSSPVSVSNNTLSYNIAVNNGIFGVVHLSGSWAVVASNLKVYNNTIVESGNIGRSKWVLISFIDKAPSASTLYYINNIAYLKDFSKVFNYTSFTHTHNIYHLINTSLNFSLATGEKTSDPGFVNLTGKDFRLASNSAAINAGKILGFTKDYAGSSIPSGSSVDIGAYEYIFTAGSTTSDDTPSQEQTEQPSETENEEKEDQPGEVLQDESSQAEQEEASDKILDKLPDSVKEKFTKTKGWLTRYLPIIEILCLIELLVMSIIAAILYYKQRHIKF